MVLQLSATLDVPMHEQNALLRAAGFSDAFSDTGVGEALDPLVRKTVEHMMTQQEPYPLVVMDSHYNVMMMNHAAQRLFVYAPGERATLLGPELYAFKLAFDQQGLRTVRLDLYASKGAITARPPSGRESHRLSQQGYSARSTPSAPLDSP